MSNFTRNTRFGLLVFAPQRFVTDVLVWPVFMPQRFVTDVLVLLTVGTIEHLFIRPTLITARFRQ
jgi:hypothetical protein